VLKYIFYTVFFGLFPIAVLEYVSVKKNYNLRPSIPLFWLSTNLSRLFYDLGVFFADVSGYIHYLVNMIDFKDFVNVTVNNLIRPTINVIGSPFMTVFGYVSELTVFEYPILIVIGSITLFVLGLYLLDRLVFATTKKYTVQWIIEWFKN
jgi:hypothetical protein